MDSPKLIRWGGLTALLGGVLGILYSPFYALAYFATEEGAGSLEAPLAAAWAGALRPILDPFLTFAPPEVVYLTYGKFFSLMVLGWMAGLLALHTRQAANAGRLEKWGFRTAFTGTVLGTLGGIGVYWIGTVWWEIVEFFFLAFMIPMLLLVSIGFPLFGIGTLRAKVAPRLGAWLLVIGGLPGMFLLTFLLGQLTLGVLLINLAWVVLGYALFSEKSAPAQATVRAPPGVCRGARRPQAFMRSPEQSELRFRDQGENGLSRPYQPIVVKNQNTRRQ